MKSLKYKVFLNFSSTVLPMFVGLITIPILIKSIGIERFGMLSIAWMIVGYFGILDMGLGRSLTQKIAHQIGIDDLNTIKTTILLALGIMAVLGILFGIGLYSFSSYIVYDGFNITKEYQTEALFGIYWIALMIPFVIVSTGLFGVLEGQQNFGWTSIVRLYLNVFMFLAPLIALQWSDSLDIIIESLFIVRVLTFVFLVAIVIYTLKDYVISKINFVEFNTLLTYSGWISISSIISPIMVFFDRFYIAIVLSVAVVAFYTTPIDILLRILLIPLALIGVMFSSFSTDWTKKPLTVLKNYKKSILAIVSFMLPLTIFVYFFAFDGLSLWLGKSFALNSFEIAQIIIIGVFFNALAMVPYALIQGVGRADITAKFHLFELPLFIALLWYFVENFGLLGAAYAWSARTFLDAMLLYWTAHRLTRHIVK